MKIFGIFLLFVFLFSLVSKRVKKTIFSGPIVFTLAGVLVFLIFPATATVDMTSEIVITLAEITLALVIFGESLRQSLKDVIGEMGLPARLLGIGMPLTILFGIIVAKLMFSDLSIWEAAILATILAPTDSSLGLAVVNSSLVPNGIREALKIEGGLNDGLSTPFLMLFIALAGGTGSNGSWLLFAAQQIGFGILAGLIIGWVGGWLLVKFGELDWISESAEQLALLSLGILTWGIAQYALGGNGFIAVFVAGSMLRETYEDAQRGFAGFDESWGNLLIYFIFYLFGMIFGTQFMVIPVNIWIYALLSLTAIRMVPVGISMIRAKLKPVSVFFMGWFGPRGLASVVLGLIYIRELVPGVENMTIIYAVIATVFLSVFLHGMTAVPGSKYYAVRINSLPDDAVEYHGDRL
jgi:NhaP-type Na+/H+ or K+/H+ antiporter